MMGGWRRFHNEELHNLSPSASTVIKSNVLRWVECVALLENLRHLNTREDNIKINSTEISETGCGRCGLD